ncbi:MAG: hypothetical protein JXR91_05660 [Deltaproteobacteria bacterium]|nr:hypothetical protein [Deltaproteobacteria bacterium]
MKNLNLTFLLLFSILTLSLTGCEGCNSKKEVGGAKATDAKKPEVKKAEEKKDIKLPEAPAELVKAIFKELDNQDPRIVWKALPASYQKDINGLVSNFAQKMDKDLWNKGFVIFSKITDVAKDKKDFIMGNEMVKQQIKVQDKQNMVKGWDGAVVALKFLATCELSKLENLTSFDGAKFLDSMMAGVAKIDKKDLDMIKELTMAYAADEKTKDSKLSDIKVEEVKADGKSATLKITAPGEEPQNIDFVLLEGRWVPAEITREWAKMIEEAKGGIAQVSGDEMTKNKPQILAMMAAVESGVDQLLNAKTQKEFDQIIMSLMQSMR